MARKLAEEFQRSASTTSNPTPQAAGAPVSATSHYGSGQSQYANSAPVSGAPSPSLVTSYYQQNAPQGVVYGSPIPPPNTSQAPTHHVHVPGAPPAYAPHPNAPTITSYAPPPPQQQQQQQHPGYLPNSYGYPPSSQQMTSAPQNYGHPSTGHPAYPSISGYPQAPSIGGYPSVGTPAPQYSQAQPDYSDPKVPLIFLHVILVNPV